MVCVHCAFGVAELANGILAIAVLFSDTLYSRHRGNIRPPVQNSIAE